MSKRMVVVALSVVVCIAGTTERAAATDQTNYCTPGWHSFVMNPNTYCYEETQEESVELCKFTCPGMVVTNTAACWIVPNGVAYGCDFANP